MYGWASANGTDLHLPHTPLRSFGDTNRILEHPHGLIKRTVVLLVQSKHTKTFAQRIIS